MADKRVKVADRADNVATGLRDIEAGDRIEVTVGETRYDLLVEEDVPFGHKVALTDIEEGETVLKYGRPIGSATRPIKTGEWVHVHNVASNYGAEGSGD